MRCLLTRAVEALEMLAVVTEQGHTDSNVMDIIAALLHGEWSPDTLDAIADTVRRTGRRIDD